MNSASPFSISQMLAHRPFLALALCLGLSVAAPASAQVDVVKGKPTVAVQPFSGLQAAEATNVLRNDLNRTMMIDVSKPSGTDFVATAEVNGLGVRGRLTDGSGQEIFNQMFQGEWRQATHAFADAVTKAVTGVEGFATSRVAFISAATGHKELYVADIDGANLQRLTQDETISNAPAWSRDGNLIAYTSYKEGYPDVFVIDLRTGQRKRVAFFPGINTGAVFSPDGEELALTLSKDGNPEIYTMPASGGQPVRVTRTRGTETSPSWSPDGERLVYSSDDRGSPQLFIMPKVGAGDPDRVYTNLAFNTEPCWSPDGGKITFTTRLNGQFQIAVYDLKAKQTATVTKNGGEDSTWTRNSRHAVYTSNGKLYVLDTATQQAMPIETGLGKITEPAVSHQAPAPRVASNAVPANDVN
ncbi:MAG: biopolymer transporter Tol [Verrucomicrobiota bacterium]